MLQILAVLALFALLTAICLRVRVGSRFHRGISRGVWAVWLLMFCGLIPGFRVGVNVLNVACVAILGLPGLALLQVIVLMP